jgi:hypothetical protein
MRTPSSAFPASPHGWVEGLIDARADAGPRTDRRRADLGAADLDDALARALFPPRAVAPEDFAVAFGGDLARVRTAPLLPTTRFVPPFFFLAFGISISFG